MTRLILAIALFSVGCAARANAPQTILEGTHLGILRAATRPFHVLDSAVAAGYAPVVRDCLVHEHHGAMGYHHVNSSYVDAKAEPHQPEILLYERLADSTYRLNGVEFIVPYKFVPRDAVPPRVMGQTMKREDNLKFWYLHAWVWTDNPEGRYADFHPGVSCSAESRKIFRPSIDGPDRGRPG